MSPALRVGIIVFAAAGTLVGVACFLSDYRLHKTGYTITVIFDNAQGLTPGSPVRMAGVTIGTVESISLNRHTQAIMHLKINRKYRIPDGSQFVLRVGLLIGEKYVDIVPNREAETFLKTGTTVEGINPILIEDVLPDALRLVANLGDLSGDLKKVIPDTQRLVGNLSDLSNRLKGVLDDDFERRIDTSLKNVEQATASLEKTTKTIESFAQGISGEEQNIHTIIANFSEASASLRDLTANLEEFAKTTKSRENIEKTLSAANRAAESLERTASSLEQVITAPEFQNDIRTTVTEARKAAEDAREVIGRVGRFFGVGPGKSGWFTRLTSGEMDMESLVIPHDGRFRTTLTTTIPLKNQEALSIGIYDVGASNKLILQPKSTLDARMHLRYGLYASRLGIGFDREFSPRIYGYINLYNPSEPRLDLYTGYRINEQLGLLIGVDNLFDDNILTFGASIRK